jgi:hypothetical protein
LVSDSSVDSSNRGAWVGLVSDSAVDSSKRRGLALDLLATAHSGGASSREPVILFLFLTV